MEPSLDPVEIRVLGCLIEKQITTPEYYPLTLNALVNACNQTTNRDPVTHYDEDAIEALLPYDVAYIGLVASRRRAATVLDVLAARGAGGLGRVRRAADSSVGGSQEEIALATLAEIVAERHVQQRRYAMQLPETAIDPICGMRVEVKGAMHTLRVGETTHYFCGAGCLDAFKLREGQSISR